jgi:hypothetical protein
VRGDFIKILNTNTACALAVFITLISATALADNATIPFNELDTNHDNILSTDEAGVPLDIATQWSKMDKDNDGRLNRAEYAIYQTPAPAAGVNKPVNTSSPDHLTEKPMGGVSAVTPARQRCIREVAAVDRRHLIL